MASTSMTTTIAMKGLLLVTFLPVVLTYALPQHDENLRLKRTVELRTRWESVLNPTQPHLRPLRPGNENHEGPLKDDNDDWYFSEEEEKGGTLDEGEGRRHDITRGGVVKPQGRRGCPGDAVFRCDNGKEVCQVKVCDGVIDCRSGEDEASCRCLEGEFVCDGSRCFPLAFRCDGYLDCADKADETNCDSAGECPGDDLFRCKSGEDVCQINVCDGAVDCLLGDDEDGCGCQAGEFMCDSSYCLPSSYRCDGHRDCSDGTDEVNCYVVW